MFAPPKTNINFRLKYHYKHLNFTICQQLRQPNVFHEKYKVNIAYIITSWQKYISHIQMCYSETSSCVYVMSVHVYVDIYSMSIVYICHQNAVQNWCFSRDQKHLGFFFFLEMMQYLKLNKGFGQT